ncbi:MAG: DUF6261 family protein [Tannerellaceae bacterium]|nr:DUF6261 family protein [Tannerellaceae bacterium]
MEIRRFAIGRLYNEEWFRFHTEFRNLVLLYAAERLGLPRLFIPYQTMYEEADRLQELLRRSFITGNISTADRMREGVYRSLRDTVRSFRNSLDADRRKASVKVDAMVSKYGRAILRATVSSRTAAIDGLLQDLTATAGGVDLSQEVQLLGIDRWLADLETVNTTYKQSLEERHSEAFGRPEAGRLKQVRVKMDHSYTNMLNLVNALLSVVTVPPSEGDEPDSSPAEGRGALPDESDERLLHFAKALNLRIAHYKTLLKKRRARSGKKDGEELN